MRRYLAVSGGADSTAMALLLHERGEDYEMVFADTGAELPETYWLLPRLALLVQKPLTVVSNGSFYQHLFGYGFLLPSVRARWCTRLLKQVPQDRFFAAQAEQGGEAVVGVGIRADEPARAQRLAARKKTGHSFDFPLVSAGMGKADVFALCRKHGLLSPVYEWRSSTSCFCCPFQRINDWRGLLQYHPDLFALAEDWEEQSAAFAQAKGYTGACTWKLGRGLRQLREATERQLRLWSEPEDEACTICRW